MKFNVLLAVGSAIVFLVGKVASWVFGRRRNGVVIWEARTMRSDGVMLTHYRPRGKWAQA